MLMEFVLKYRRIVVIGVHLFLILAANLFAFLLRFEWMVPADYFRMIGVTLPVIVLVRLVTFHFYDLHTGLWRYVSVRDLVQIIKGVVLSSAIIGLVIYPVMGLHSYPRAVVVLEGILLIMFMGGIRVGTRLIREKDRMHLFGKKPVFIYGAGDAGELLLRDMHNNTKYNYQPVGFLDDDERKKGLKIHSVPVLGSGKDLGGLIKKYRPEEIIVAIPSATPVQMRTIMYECNKYDISLKTLPSLKDVISGHVSVKEIRDVSIEDLLFREPVQVNPDNIRDLVSNKRVLVTGAAGSIGSELCRQILRHNPRHLVLYDRNENGLYHIDRELGGKFSRDFFSVVIGDICDMSRMCLKLKQYRPQIIFHAAAYKHVPLMEDNVVESVRNNVLGTWNLLELADQSGVESFVQISTDKAVNPTSIMGASKRIAEMAVKYMNMTSKTRFMVVRFGNVLDSNGSVVPLFKEQIRNGGPITVTHVDMQRYFMTIPEAVQLVLQAAHMGKGGEVFVLDMGEQVRIVDLARNMTTLSGLEPDKDIKIIFTGLRPGEKLYEELFDGNEKTLATSHRKISMAISTVNGNDYEKFFNDLIEMQVFVSGGDKRQIGEKIKELVPTYNPNPVALYKNGGISKSIITGTQDQVRPDVRSHPPNQADGKPGLSDLSAST